MRQPELQTRTILITGASRGIGAAVAVAAAEAGADVALSYRASEGPAGEVAERIRAFGRRCEAYQADISRLEDVEALVASVQTDFGKIDGLVANAGIMPISPFLEMSVGEWDDVIRTDLYGPFFCARAVLPAMVERGSGAIVMVSSRLGQVGAVDVAHYCAAKAGVIGLTKALAREFAFRGVRVNAVAPGVTRTDMGGTVMTGETGRRKMAELPLGRFGEPSEVANAVVFLLSDASSLFVGQTLNPNAGGFMP